MVESDALRRVRGFLAFLRANSVQRILQIGCNDIEVTSLLISEGFKVTILDRSRESLAGLKKALDAFEFSAEFIQAYFNELPVPERHFDFALAYNSLYHADYEGLKRSLEGFFSRLRDEGLFFVTLISTRHTDYGRGEEIEPGTFGLEGSIRHFSDGADIVDLTRHVEIVDLRNEEQGIPGSFHWHVLGRNRDLSVPEEGLSSTP